MAGVQLDRGRIVDLIWRAEGQETGAGVIVAAELQEISADGISSRRREE